MAESYKFGHWGSTTEEILETHYPLHRACRDGDVEKLSLLLVEAQHGIYEEDSFYGWTPAHWAAYFGKLNCLMYLLESGMNCDATTIRLTQTPAHIAAFGGHSHCLKWLLHCGAAINKQDYLREVPVHKAARTGSMECASLLVSHNARLSEVNNAGQTPAQLAGLCGFEECARFLEAAAQRQEALAQGGDIPQTSPDHHPVVVNKDVSACVINHGLNRGKLPPPTSTARVLSHHGGELEDPSHTEMEDESDHLDLDPRSQEDITQSLPFVQNGHAHLTNGHVAPHHHQVHRPVLNHHVTTGSHGDITVHHGISVNQVPVAGCKRTREDIDDMDTKRIRRNVVSNSWAEPDGLSFSSPLIALDYDDQVGYDYNGLPQFGDENSNPNCALEGLDTDPVEAAQALENDQQKCPRSDPDHGPPEDCCQDGFHAGDFNHYVRHPPDLFTREACSSGALSKAAVVLNQGVVAVANGDGHDHMDSLSSHHGGSYSPVSDSMRESLMQAVPENVANGVVAYVQDALTSSAMEHHHTVMLEQGYDSMFCEAMTTPPTSYS